MRKTFAGITALAVATGLLGFSGAAQAIPLTDTTTVLTVGNIAWSVGSCNGLSGSGDCADFFMDAAPGGVKISFGPGVSGEDVSVDILATAITGSIGSAGLIVTNGSGSATVFDTSLDQLTYLSSSSGSLSSSLFDPLYGPSSPVAFSMDIPAGSAPVVLLANVPEPASLSVFGLALIALTGLRRRARA